MRLAVLKVVLEFLQASNIRVAHSVFRQASHPVKLQYQSNTMPVGARSILGLLMHRFLSWTTYA